MPRKKQTFQTPDGPITANVPLSYEFENSMRILIDSSDIKRKWIDLPYGPDAKNEVLDLYLPNEGDGPFPVVIFVHGGGWINGDKDYWEFHSGFKAVRFGFAVASVRYRLAPEFPHPAQIHDVKAAIRFIKANAEKYNLDAGKVALWGASAGGHLVSLAGTSANRSELTDRSLGNPDVDESVQAVVDWYGPTRIDLMNQDFEALNVFTDALQGDAGSDSIACKVFHCAPEEVPLHAKAFSPISYITKDCPPFLIQHGTADTMVPILQSIRFDKALTEVVGEEKVTLDLLHNQGHGSLVFESYDNIKRITDWLREAMK